MQEDLTLEEILLAYDNAKLKALAAHGKNHGAHIEATRETYFWSRMKSLWHLRGGLIALEKEANLSRDDFPGMVAGLYVLVGAVIGRMRAGEPPLTPADQALMDLARGSFDIAFEGNVDSLRGTRSSVNIDKGFRLLSEIRNTGIFKRRRACYGCGRAEENQSPGVPKLAFPEDPPVHPTKVSTYRGGTCAYCEEVGTTIDHVIPRSMGGADIPINRVAACLPCNAAKADALLNGIRFDPNHVALFPVEVDWEKARAHVRALRRLSEERSKEKAS